MASLVPGPTSTEKAIDSALEHSAPTQGGEVSSGEVNPQAQLERADDEQMASIPATASSVPAVLTHSRNNSVDHTNAPLSATHAVLPEAPAVTSVVSAVSEGGAATSEVELTGLNRDSSALLHDNLPSSPANAATSPLHAELSPPPSTDGVVISPAVPISDPIKASSSSLLDGPDTPIQLLSLAGLVSRLQTNLDLANVRNSQGLSSKEAAERLARDGLNALTPPKETPEIIKYLSHYLDPFMILLTLCGVLSCIAYAADTSQEINLWIGVVLFGVVILSSTFAYVQSGKASAVMKAFKNMLPKVCHVIRDGRLQDINASQLVVGDVVKVGGGDQVPADLRLCYCNDLKVEVSSLTGESLPISCTTTTKEERVEEAKNITFNSSQCLEGEAVGVVYATGDRTLIGKIARLASQTTTVDTTLQREVKGFVKKLTIFSFIMGIVFFAIGLGRNGTAKDAAIDSFINGFIVVLIANVPEGLPVTVVTILTITGRRLAALNVFVKQLASVETLGSATVIASDKTGTLTQNKMSVSRLWFDLTPMSVETVYRDLGPSTLTMNPNSVAKSLYSGTATLRALERVCAVCSRTRFEDHRELSDEEARAIEQNQTLRQLDPSMTLRSAKAAYPQFLSMLDSNMTINSAKRQALTGARDDSKRGVIGDASETALFNFIRARQSMELVRYHNRVVFDVPFNSRNKYALTIMKPYQIPGNTDHRRVLLMKGAPEIILERCNRWMNRGKIQPIDEEFKENFQMAYETFGGFGERVLGFAQLELEEKEFPAEMDTQYSQKDENYPTRDLVFLGLISLVDPPKETVPGAIAMCRSAGVRVVMVTGDHPLTAAAIARQVGIITGNTREELAKIHGVPPSQISEDQVDAVVIRGSDLDKWTQADWDLALCKPEVVFARTTPSQKLQIVENLQRLGNIVAVTGDGVNDPALKKADIGVAMGISGSDVARDAGDVILMDDDFGSIVVGIREGRTIFDNLTKTIAYTVTHMVPEVIPILLNLAFGIPLGLNAILILAIDIGTELAPAISLAYEKAESDVMSRPPRNAKTDHLVTAKTVTYWYLMAGAWELLTCYLAFFLVFSHYGIAPHYLPWSDRNNHFSGTTTNDVFYTDRGDAYDDDAQKRILAEAQTAFWVTLTMQQVFHIWMCKTRVLSVWQHGWFDNILMDYGVCVELAIIMVIAFIPPNGFFQNEQFPGFVWSIFLVGWAGLFLLNEPRKWLIRHYPRNKFVEFLAW